MTGGAEGRRKGKGKRKRKERVLGVDLEAVWESLSCEGMLIIIVMLMLSRRAQDELLADSCVTSIHYTSYRPAVKNINRRYRGYHLHNCQSCATGVARKYNNNTEK